MIETPEHAARRLAAAMIAKGFALEAVHPYPDAAGVPIYWRIRLKHPETGEKTIYPMHWNGAEYELKEPKFDGKKPLYGPIAESATRWVVEGEPHADALRALAFSATTSGAANSARGADWSALAGSEVVIWPDRDATGTQYAHDVTDECRAQNCRVRWVDIAQLGLSEGGDVLDWLGVHPDATAADIESLPLVDPPPRPMVEAEWPEPLPLPEGLPPVEAFDFDLLPTRVRAWAEDICDRVRCPPDYVAVAIMAGLGSLIGRKLGIRPQARTDWTVTANQWALLVGRPGVLKSPAIEAALAPMRRLAAVAQEDYERRLVEYGRCTQAAKLRATAAGKKATQELAKNLDADISQFLQEEPEEPVLTRYIVNDATAAALGELLRQNPSGLLLHRDEIVSLLRTLDREDQADARGFYLTAWNGDSAYTFDRIARGMNLHIPAVCLSLVGSTQPGRLSAYTHMAVQGGQGDDGLLQRFGLLVWPDVSADWCNVDRWPDTDAKREAFAVFTALADLDPVALGAEYDSDLDGEREGIPFLRFDDDARDAFVEWRTGLEARMRSEELHPAMESHLAKYRKLVPGLALILHLASGGIGPVSLSPTLQALAWSVYLESHARRAYSSATNPEEEAARAIVRRLRKGDLPREFGCWELVRKGWASLAERETVEDALALLVELGWLRTETRRTTGRTAHLYVANPRGLA